MESQKTINLPEKTSDNKDLLKKRNYKKKIYSNSKEIKTEKQLIFFSINDDSIVKKWNFKKL